MKCRRTACQVEGADCRHTMTGEMYCAACARLINRANPEVLGLVAIPGRVIVVTVGQHDSFLAVCEDRVQAEDYVATFSSDGKLPEVIRRTTGAVEYAGGFRLYLKALRK